MYGPGTFLNRAVTAVNQQVTQMLSSANQTDPARSQAAYQLALARHMSRKQAATEAKARLSSSTSSSSSSSSSSYFQSGIQGDPADRRR